MLTRTLLVLCVLLSLVPLPCYGQTWDLAADFSGTENPNGVWSYGWRSNPDQPLTLYVDHGPYPCTELTVWMYNFYEYCPMLAENMGDLPALCFNEFTIEPHQVMFHPGIEQQSVIRWTAPSDLEVVLSAQFRSIDWGAKTVRVYHNQAELFSTPLEGDQTADFSIAVTVVAGDILECAVDPILFYYNSTGVDFRIVEGGSVPVNETTWGRVKASYR